MKSSIFDSRPDLTLKIKLLGKIKVGVGLQFVSETNWNDEEKVFKSLSERSQNSHKTRTLSS